MIRRDLFALIAISLTTLSACVTKVVETPSTMLPEVTTSTVATSISKPEETLGEKARRETLEKRQEPESKRQFLRSIRRNAFAAFSATEKQLVALWKVGQVACEFFDSGGTLPEFRELAPDSSTGVADYFEAIAEAAVFSICVEHVPKLTE